jgi:colanic acid/amylovoran biosynthesis glycosyltransferase
MTIGLVMTGLPQYSETFLNSKIKGLIESGFTVIVFTDSAPHYKTEYRCVSAFPIWRNKLFQTLFSSLVLVLSIFRAPGATVRFWRLQKRDGKQLRDIIKSIYQNAHILPRRVNWLHYTFATFAIGREQLAKSIRARMGVSFRGFDMAVYPVKHPGCYEVFWKYVDKVHTISDALLIKARSAGMAHATPSVKITPAIPIRDFHTPRPVLGEIRDPIRLSTVGRLHWVKGYETALTALSILKKSGIRFKYRIAGAGSDLERLVFAAHTLGISDDVVFEGKLHSKAVFELYDQTDIYLQPSIFEGFCNSVLEAQLSGALCIVSDAGGLMENVVHNKTGWVVPRRNPDAIAEAIRNIMTMSDSDRRNITEAAIARVKADFDLNGQQLLFREFFMEAAIA